MTALSAIVVAVLPIDSRNEENRLSKRGEAAGR
jgi:hypothetical protein